MERFTFSMDELLQISEVLVLQSADMSVSHQHLNWLISHSASNPTLKQKGSEQHKTRIMATKILQSVLFLENIVLVFLQKITKIILF